MIRYDSAGIMNRHRPSIRDGCWPKVTVGLPTYNGCNRISRAIGSVLAQEYPDLELIISDNGSTDTTMDVCLDLGKKNRCIRYYRQPHNIGVMQNFEFVLRQASGEFFMWLSDDDAFEPGILHRYVRFLSDHPEYALVSGRIKYWVGEQPVFCENDFRLEQGRGAIRLLAFYLQVVYGSVFYGLMRTALARRIPLRNRIGGDWHFVAAVAYLGKIRNMPCIGYHKRCGGLSKDFHQYAKATGATSFAARYPHVQIALDALYEIMRYSPVFTEQSAGKRIVLAVTSFMAILLNFYGRQYPFILGGKIKRMLRLPTSGSRRLWAPRKAPNQV